VARDGPPEYGTLIIAALLILALAFAGNWIIAYVQPGRSPRALLWWFGIAAIAIVVGGLAVYMRPWRRGQDDDGDANRSQPRQP
jgi:membrane protein implicated in regulation of membrane protease activity